MEPIVNACTLGDLISKEVITQPGSFHSGKKTL